jgi:hypothetical protein
MARRRNQGRAWRCNLTISEEAAGRLKTYAASVDRRPTTAAAELLLAGLAAATGEAEEELADLRRRNQELQDQVDALRRSQLEDLDAAERADDDRSSPRWERPVEELLADTGWWDRWLPRLYELLGRVDSGLPYLNGDGGAPTDDRGYTDLMARLFPPVESITWRSPDYPRAMAGNAFGDGYGARGLLTCVQVWEPVLRHVALALSALEDTGVAGSSPQVRLETLARLTGSWVNVLRNMTGEPPSNPLPGPIR